MALQSVLCMMISLMQMKLLVLFGLLTGGCHPLYLQFEKDIVLLLLQTCFIMVAENLSGENLMAKSIG